MPAQTLTSTPTALTRIEPAGKFFRCGDARWFARIFDCNGEDPGDFQALAESGYNAVRISGRISEKTVDSARKAGLRLLASVAWRQDIDFLHTNSAALQEAVAETRDLAEKLGNDAILLGILVADRIPPSLVRWMGPDAVTKALSEVIAAGKAAAPRCLFGCGEEFTAVHLQLPGADFAWFYLGAEGEFDPRALQVAAGHLPVIASCAGQSAEALSGIRDRCGEAGMAGICLARRAEDLTNWPQPDLSAQPPVSVIVCAKRRHRQLADCLEALERLNYPEFEVIAINRGNDGDVARVAADFAKVRHVPADAEEGLAAARNLGASEATGKILAFIGEDCVADEDWLFWLAKTFAQGDFGAVTGPSIPPKPDSAEQAGVLAAPNQGLRSDPSATQPSGSNLAIWKDAWDALGGFDPRFRNAGCEVDFARRLHDRGYRVGFSPVAFVRRNAELSYAAYIRRQAEIGEAEGLLVSAHPDWFTGFGPEDRAPAPRRRPASQLEPRFASLGSRLRLAAVAIWAKWRRNLSRLAASWKIPRFRQVDGFPSGHDALEFSSAAGLERETLLEALTAKLSENGDVVWPAGDWSRWDLLAAVSPLIAGKIRTATEHHEGGSTLVRLDVDWAMSWQTWMVHAFWLIFLVMAVTVLPTWMVVFPALIIAAWAYQISEEQREFRDKIEETAREMGFET